MEEAELLCMKIRAFLQSAELSEVSFPVELLARECLTNAVIHGNRNAADKTVVFNLAVGRKWIRLQVSDEGHGFRWRNQREERQDTTIPSGRGVPLYALYAERVRFNRSGNRVALWVRKMKLREKEARKMAAYVLKQDDGQGSVTLQGDLTAIVVPDLQADLKDMLNKGARQLEFDLSNTAMLDSSGMGLLIAAANSVVSQGGNIRVTNVAPDIFRLLQSMRLTTRLNVSERA